MIGYAQKIWSYHNLLNHWILLNFSDLIINKAQNHERMRQIMKEAQIYWKVSQICFIIL